jgi:hypothetical protein
MRKAKYLGGLLFAAGFLTMTGAFPAQEQKGKGERNDAAVLRDALKEVINAGAELFNKYGDHAGCYRLYQGSLITIKPFLAPATQKEIEMALAEAEKQPRLSDRAFVLRKTLDGIRAQTAEKKAEEKKDDK